MVMESSVQQKEDPPLRPLGIIKEILDSLGMEITYVYEDLVFIEHNHFLLQFGEVAEKAYFYQNTDCDDDESTAQYAQIAEVAATKDIELEYKGKYFLKDNDDGTISIEFLETAG